MSALVPAAKVEAVRALGAEVRIVGRSQDEAAVESRRLATEEGLAEIAPFDDAHVIAGQGTAGLELVEDRPDLATVVVPLSGGGLAAGVALAVKAANPAARVVGVSMDRGAAMHAAVAAGRPVPVEEVESLADSLGGGLGDDNHLSFALCRALLDDILLVTEEEIYRAMQALYWHDRLVTEGAAAVGAAALLSGRLKPQGPTALLVTGRNVDMETFTRVVTGQAGHPRHPHHRRPPPCPMTSSSSPRPSSAAPCRSTSPPSTPSSAPSPPCTPAASSCRRCCRWRSRPRTARSTSRPPTSPASTASRSRSAPASSTTRSSGCRASTA